MVTIKVRTRLAYQWAMIAVDHEVVARAARADGIARAVGVGEAIERELHASMVAIAAAAFAIEAWTKAVESYLPTPTKRARMSHTQVVRTLERGFDVDASRDRWITELFWLFKVARDELVHPVEVETEPVPHPTGTRTTVESALYSSETTTRAVDLMIEVLQTCFANPNRDVPELAEEVRRESGVLTQIVARRSAPRDSRRRD